MSERDGRLWRGLAVVVGASLTLAYFAYQLLEPHGAHEFAYSPFTPAPLPYSPMRGFTYEQLWGHIRRIFLLGPGLLLLGFGLASWLKLRAPSNLGRACWLLSAAGVALTALLLLGVLRGRAISADELCYAMQATFFGEGRLTGIDVGLTPPDAFTVPTLIGYTAKYLPGEGLLQIPGVWLGVPALMHLPVVALTLWGFHRALGLSSGPRIAHLATAALGCSPMLIFTSATGLSHATTLMWIVLMGLGVELARSGKVLGGAALGGLAFSFGFATRPQSMLPAGAVLGLALLLVLFRRRGYLALLVLALVSAAGLGCVLAYNHRLSGSWLGLPWFLQCGAEHYGFGPVWAVYRYVHTPLTALENLGVVALRLNSWWLGLPLSLAVVAAWAWWRLGTAGAAQWLYVGAAIIVFEFFYYSPGASDTGSIYHYELLLPGALMAALVADRLLTQFTSGPLVIALGLVLGNGSWLVEQGLRLDRLVELIHRDSDAALARIDGNALIIHESAPGESVVRGWPSDTFPRRFRGQSDRVVTFPRVSARTAPDAMVAYPGRQCWYFRYLPGTDTPELLRCDAASGLMARDPYAASTVHPYFERPTAYFKSTYHPLKEASRLRRVGKTGKPLALCCEVETGAASGSTFPVEISAECLDSGEPALNRMPRARAPK